MTGPLLALAAGIVVALLLLVRRRRAVDPDPAEMSRAAMLQQLAELRPRRTTTRRTRRFERGRLRHGR